MDEYREFLRFPEIAQASEYTAVLDRHDIPFQLDDISMRFKLVSVESPWESQFILQIKERDHLRAEELFVKEFGKEEEEIPVEEPGHFLQNYSDTEMLNLLANRKEWPPDVVLLALRIAEQRGLEVPPEIPDALRKPVEEKKEISWIFTFNSMLLFFVAYYAIFGWDLSFITLLLVVIFIHEMGHFLAMKYYKYADVKMFFIPLMGALVTGKQKNISQRQDAIITLAGPVPGIMLGLVCYFYSSRSENPLFHTAANLFIYINAFNLLPLTPLDGGRLIDTLFFSAREKLHTVFTLLSIIGLCCLAYYLNSWALLILPFFTLMQLTNKPKWKKIKTLLDQDGVNYNKSYEEISPEEYWKIRSRIISCFSTFKSIDPFVQQFSEKEQSILKYVQSLCGNQKTHDLSVLEKVVFIATWIFFLFSPVLLVLAMRYYS